jgi:hypothetical protein
MMTVIDEAAAKLLHLQADCALKTIAAEHGLVWNPAKGIYNADNGTFAIKGSFSLPVVGGKPRDQFEFERDAGDHGLKPEHFKAHIVHEALEYEVVGFYPKSEKFPIKAVRLADKRTYGLPAGSVLSLPGAVPPPLKIRLPRF